MLASRDAQGTRTALVTGVGRSIGIGAAVAAALKADGWRVLTTGWQAYDQRMTWGADALTLTDVEADLADPEVPASLFRHANQLAGMVSALVCCHCESVDSSILDTTLESFDRHFAINARATWLLIKAFAEQFTASPGTGRIVAITSDHTAFNLPYGASKGAMDRIVIASATELASLGITANIVNPGATDTGWLDAATEKDVRARNLQARIGSPADCANLVRFLCSTEGQWINGQVLYSDGGLKR
jgi:3-oxoacyl-[acyl-carrier protein] reductase